MDRIRLLSLLEKVTPPRIFDEIGFDRKKTDCQKDCGADPFPVID
ncbi:MAG: hypothetical protein SOY45_03085 [Lachnospiraceae bacterium]|nr:hypothetical protein [Lachnospiraceae bacterium]